MRRKTRLADAVLYVLFLSSFVGLYLLYKNQLQISKLLDSRLSSIGSKIETLETSISSQESKTDEAINELEKYKLISLETKQIMDRNQRPILSSIVKQWKPYAAYIICSWGEPPNKFASGSGRVYGFTKDGNPKILTNKHVLIEDGKTPHECFVTTPENNNIYNVKNPEIIRLADKKIDAAYLVISKADQALKNISEQALNMKNCSERASEGDSLIAIGYPSIGGPAGSVTVTEGIISAYEKNYYISSVKIDKGNSGGLAISVDENCYLGMPTYAVVGEAESLARILDYNYILKKDN